MAVEGPCEAWLLELPADCNVKYVLNSFRAWPRMNLALFPASSSLQAAVGGPISTWGRLREMYGGVVQGSRTSETSIRSTTPPEP
jgi:hypothetical protein